MFSEFGMIKMMGGLGFFKRGILTGKFRVARVKAKMRPFCTFGKAYDYMFSRTQLL